MVACTLHTSTVMNHLIVFSMQNMFEVAKKRSLNCSKVAHYERTWGPVTVCCYSNGTHVDMHTRRVIAPTWLCSCIRATHSHQLHRPISCRNMHTQMAQIDHQTDGQTNDQMATVQQIEMQALISHSTGLSVFTGKNNISLFLICMSH